MPQNKPHRAFILIDGSNFYFKLKDLRLSDQLKFNFQSFCKSLCVGYENFDCTYYIGAVKTDGTKKVAFSHAQQQKLFAHLKTHQIGYELGYLLKSNGKMSEKGVDVHMAVDILVNTYENTVDKILLVSSDTDLIPAIKVAKQKGVKVEYIGFKHMPSQALKRNSSSYRLLTKNDIKAHIAKEPPAPKAL